MTERDIFIAALQKKDEAKRRAYLDEACAQQPDLRKQVEQLLRLNEEAGSFLEKPAAESAATGAFPDRAAHAPASESSGTVIGSYKLVEQIGEGGMGTVWMAQQTEPVKRLVALKLIKAGMDSKQVIARFDAERQALALMDHPNIARVLDGGTTSAGRPYFVMDLVKGVPITRYCDEHHLTLRQRLELFLPVCQAIQHAHQKGIIHRDVKPNNVLVAPYDGKPVVKVIDFGVAKAAGQQLTDRTLVTGFGAIVGTLEYMSPEQAELNNHDIDTRSDIYSLGVLLYELLAGSPPFTRNELEKGGMLETLRMIREEEPTKPSAKLSTADGLPTLAVNRGTEPVKLTRLVRGELDWIVMKALEKDRGRRYETTNGFAADIGRYLADEAVLACPPSAGYRLRKFIRKNRGPVVAAGLLMVTLLGGIMGTTWGLLRADQERHWAETKKQEAVEERNAKDVALHAEQQARTDEKKARQQAFAALRSMTDDVVERKFEQGAVLTEDDRAFLRGIIAQFDAFAAIKGEDAESRAVRAEGRFLVGNIRFRLGELLVAEKDYDQAVCIYGQLTADFPSRFEFRYQQARSHIGLGNVRYHTGRRQEAERDYNQALILFQQLPAGYASRPEFRQKLAVCHHNRGALLREMGRPKEAEKDYDQALSIQKQLVNDFPSRPEFRQDLARTHNSRGNLLRITGRRQEAERDYDQAESIQKWLVQEFPSSPDFRVGLALAYHNQGLLQHKLDRLQQAEPRFDLAVGIFKKLAADFPSRPDIHERLANSYQSRGALLLQGWRMAIRNCLT